MRSLYELERAVDNNDITLTNSLGTLNTKVNSMEGVQVGSNSLRVLNVASIPTTVPDGGILLWDTTAKVLAISDGTSIWNTHNGSLATAT